MEKFAYYGFNKVALRGLRLPRVRHRVSESALSAGVPVSALLTSETGNTAKGRQVHQRSADEMNIRVLAPDVNSSEFTFYSRSHRSRMLGIRFGLGAIKTSDRMPSIRSSAHRKRYSGPLTPIFASVSIWAREPPQTKVLSRPERWIRSKLPALAVDGAVIDGAMETGAAQKDSRQRTIRPVRGLDGGTGALRSSFAQSSDESVIMLTVEILVFTPAVILSISSAE